MPSMRKIIHIDMDCFFAAVEIRDRPELAKKPVAVGGTRARGVLTTCNYHARTFGCHSGMPAFQALQRCPQLILLPTNFEKYQFESKRIRSIFADYTERIEPLSLDEAYLDVSEITDRYAWDVAKEIRQRIRAETGLTASAGIAGNKLLAKIASDWRKPDGQFAVLPEQVDAFMKTLPVGKIWGVGKRTRERLASRGIETCGQLQQLSELEMLQEFGSFGESLFCLCRGVDTREVVVERERKSMSTETTFANDLQEIEQAVSELRRLSEELAVEFERSRHRSRRITTGFVKLKFSDFQTTTRAGACNQIDPVHFETLLRQAWDRGNGKVRLLGVGVRFAPAVSPPDDQMVLELMSGDASME